MCEISVWKSLLFDGIDLFGGIWSVTAVSPVSFTEQLWIDVHIHSYYRIHPKAVENFKQWHMELKSAI